MTQCIRCDQCGKTADQNEALLDAFNAWYVLSLATVEDKHFHSYECLREWVSPEATAARIAERDDPDN